MFSSELKVNDQRLVQASEEWMTLVTSLVYDVYGAATTVDEARASLGLQSMAWQDPRNVLITGGRGAFDALRVYRTPVEPTDAVPMGHVKSALLALALPFTAAGDLLTYKSASRVAPAVLPIGTSGQLLDAQTLSWVTPLPPVPETSLPSSVIAGLYTVSVGSTPHPTVHDQHFGSVADFNTWAADKIVLDQLTVLPNGLTLGDNSVLELPRTVAGATVFLDEPQLFETNGHARAFSGVTLRARGTHISANYLTVFAKYDLESCELEIKDWWVNFLQLPNVHRLLGAQCRAQIGVLRIGTVTGLASSVWETVDAVLDVDTLQIEGPVGGSLRLFDTDLTICSMTEPAQQTLLRLHNSSMYVTESYSATSKRLEIVAFDSHVHLASGNTV